MARRTIPILISLTITGLCLFLPAGRLDWLRGWILLGLSFAAGIAATVVLARDPALLAERRNVKAGKGWDKIIVPFVVLVGPATVWITAGLDVRHHWSRPMPSWIFAGGIALAAIGGGIVVWAMRTNRFFSAVVRIQRDRGQTVATGGPYRYVRHPGYVGMTAFLFATPLILGSWWAFIPSVATAAVTVLRTALEDHTLQVELEGYADYVRNVRYRLVPFVW